MYKEKNRQTRQLKKWYVEVRDHMGIVRDFPAFTDKKQSAKVGEKIEKLVVCRLNNESLGRDLSEWLERMPAKLRNRLIKIGLIDTKRATVGKLLLEHLEDFKQSLLAKGNTDKHAQQTYFRVKRIFNECKFEYWSDISMSVIQKKISDLQNQVEVVEIEKNNGKKVKTRKLKNLGDASIKTKNYYIKSLKQFGSWMVNDRRVNESPLRYLQKISGDGTERHPRRSLGIDEARMLLEATQAAPERFGMTGHERALLYRLAIETGLRANELRNLTVSSFDLKACTVTAVAAYSKNRKEYTLPLKEDTAAILKGLFAGKMPSTKAFKVPNKPVDMLRADLEDAKIPYVDDAGSYADFHALRHTTGSFLVASGAHPKVAQSILRHCDINLTMGRYTHVLRGQESKAVAKLPDLSQPSKGKQKAIATGTDGKTIQENIPFLGGQQRISVNSNKQQNRVSSIANAVFERARQDSNLQPSDSKSATLSN